MKLNGIHHITAITGDAQVNLDFYVGLLGLRFVKKTINFDAPDVYHLYYGDDVGRPGSILTFFEFPSAAPGSHAAGMIHRIIWRVPSRSSIDFWAARLSGADVEFERTETSLVFSDPEGLGLELAVDERDEPLTAAQPDVPPEHALTGFQGVRAYASGPGASTGLLTETLGFEGSDESHFTLTGESRRATYVYDAPTGGRGVQGAGTVHHIAWACRTGDHEAWRRRVVDAGMEVTPIIDRQYFHSIYFREPSGVLFEIATSDPGFTVDEDEARLGEDLKLPPQYEPMRSILERKLTPLRDPRAPVAP